MLHALLRNIVLITSLPCITFALTLLIPFTALAETQTLLCQIALTELKHTQSVLLPLKQEQQQIQQHVRTIYQELFTCQSEKALSTAQQQHCTKLREEGPKQFQAMVKTITLAHQTSRQLAYQTRQAQLTCPAILEETFPKITKLNQS